jgi:hypothetical protein
LAASVMQKKYVLIWKNMLSCPLAIHANASMWNNNFAMYANVSRDYMNNHTEPKYCEAMDVENRCDVSGVQCNEPSNAATCDFALYQKRVANFSRLVQSSKVHSLGCAAYHCTSGAGHTNVWDRAGEAVQMACLLLHKLTTPDSSLSTSADELHRLFLVCSETDNYPSNGSVEQMDNWSANVRGLVDPTTLYRELAMAALNEFKWLNFLIYLVDDKVRDQPPKYVLRSSTLTWSEHYHAVMATVKFAIGLLFFQEEHTLTWSTQCFGWDHDQWHRMAEQALVHIFEIR